MDLRIDGKVALVTGASQGIGLGIAQALAREGARVALASRSQDRIAAAARTLPDGRGFSHDVSDAAGAPALVRSVEDDLGPIEILVVNTGGPQAFQDALEPGPEQWREAYESLLFGSIALVEAVLPGMTARGWGRVLSVSSSVAREPTPNLILSASHRAGLLGALKVLAHQVAADGVTINSVLPGRIATDRLVENFGSIEQAAEVARKEIPAQRLGSVEEVAAAAAFLCSSGASYITGTTLLIDGGLTRSV